MTRGEIARYDSIDSPGIDLISDLSARAGRQRGQVQAAKGGEESSS